jgi:hypothetical protein
MKVLKKTGNRCIPGGKMRAAMTVTGGGALNVSHLGAVLAWRGQRQMVPTTLGGADRDRGGGGGHGNFTGMGGGK